MRYSLATRSPQTLRFELTGALQLVVPFMVAIMVANWVGRLPSAKSDIEVVTLRGTWSTTCRTSWGEIFVGKTWCGTTVWGIFVKFLMVQFCT